MMAPKVSVVMAVHNGERYLAEAMESILDQSLRQFEFIVIDDASTDGSAAILNGYADQRIHQITNRKRLGLTRSLNLGLKQANAEYIARMDHDDISLQPRLALQAAYLDAYPDVDVCGTWAKTLGLDPEQTWRYPVEDGEIRSEMLFNSVLVHSSVMLRRAALEAHGLHYDPKIERAQDYELWAAGQLRFANIDRVLLRYRIHAEQVGKHQSTQQQAVAQIVRRRQVEALGIQPSQQQMELHEAISQWAFRKDLEFLQTVETWLLTLRNANAGQKIYPEPTFSRILGRRWWAACKAAQALGPVAWKKYRQSTLSGFGSPGILPLIRFFLKSRMV
jgi:hypothetical protein